MIDGELYWSGIPVRRSPSYSDGDRDGGRDYNSHQVYWDRLLDRVLDSKYGNYDYDDFPRGRVIFRGKDKTYEIMISSDLKHQSRILSQIKSEMNLPPNTDIVWDPVY